MSRAVTLKEALEAAVASHRAGNLRDAERLYRLVLEKAPAQPDANHNLGILALRTGRELEGLDLLKAAFLSHRAHAQYCFSYVEAMLATGRADEALRTIDSAIAHGLNADAAAPLRQKAQDIGQLVRLFESRQFAELASAAQRMTAQHADCGFAWKALGTALQIQGKKAIAALRRAVALLPYDAAAQNNLASALADEGALEEAIDACRKALAIKPDFAEARANMGNILQRSGDVVEAIKFFESALTLAPNMAEAHYNMGNAKRKLGATEDAANCFIRALQIQPDHTRALNNLGNARRDAGRHEEALACYRRALTLEPQSAKSLCNLGSTQKELGQLEEAVTSLRRALSIAPDLAEAHHNLGLVLHDSGLSEEAILHFRQAQILRPDHLEHAIHANLLLPQIAETSALTSAWRDRISNGLATLWNTAGKLDNPAETTNPLLFYLAYQNRNDRQFAEDLCRFFRARVKDLSAAFPENPGPPVQTGRRIRVGIVSEFFHGHTIAKLYRGLVRHLDRARFDVVVVHPPKARRDAFREEFDALADSVVCLPPLLQHQQNAMHAQQFDVLFYPDIGMAQSTYFLAYCRCAPVQVTSWGHPNTTGLDSIDYFVSAGCIEPEDADEHYAERLVRFDRIPCCYPKPVAPSPIPGRAALGLPASGTLYGCLQTLFKFHPDFDAILEAIAVGDPAGHIVLIEGRNPSWMKQLKTRWEKSAPTFLDRLVSFPTMPLDRFMMLTSHMDVMLDPIHFGSGNTLYESMLVGTPVVTWPGRFMRGRVVAGAYRQMRIAGAPIAARLEDYAPLAISLANDRERNRSLRMSLSQAADKELFDDVRAVREFETFFDAALSAAHQGQKLPPGWCP